MITNIERKVSIKKDNKLLQDKINLVSRYGYIFNNIIKTIDNKVVDIINNKVLYEGKNVTLDSDNKLILDNIFSNIYKVYDINGNYLFEGRSIRVLSNDLFVRNIDKVDIFGNLSNKKVLCDNKGNIINNKSYNELISYSCDRIITIKDKGYGVIDSLGNTIVKPKYKYISKFINNVAIICDYDGYSLMDVFGNIITSFKYDHICLLNEIYRVEKDKKVGYINSLGEVIVPMNFEYIGNYSDELTVVRVGDKFGFINKDNKLVIDAIYDNAYGFNNGYARVIKNDETREKGYIEYIIDTSGNIVSEIEDDIVNISDYYDDLLVATKIIGEDTKIGYVNRLGETIIPYIYDEVYPFKEGLAVVKQDDKCGVIDKNNNLIVDFKYDYISSFCNNYAIIRDKKFNNFGLIDNKGNIILPSVFNNIILLNDNKVYVEGYIYDIEKIELDYKIIINDDDRIIVKNFNSEKEMNNYYNLFINEYINFMEKLELNNPKKLVKNK